MRKFASVIVIMTLIVLCFGVLATTSGLGNLTEPYSIYGHVNTEAGNDAVNAEVFCRYNDTGATLTTTTDSAGYFMFDISTFSASTIELRFESASADEIYPAIPDTWETKDNPKGTHPSPYDIGDFDLEEPAPPMPDASIIASDIALSPSGPVGMGTLVTITANIKNIGTLDMTSGSVDFYDDDPNNPAKQIGTTQSIAIPAGSSQIVNEVWTAETVKSHNIYVKITGVSPEEITETNNQAYKSIDVVLDEPDLSISSSGITFYDQESTQITTIETQETVTIKARIYNNGIQTANSATVTFYDGNPGSPETGEIGSQTITSLDPGESITVQTTWQTPTITVDTNYDIYVKISLTTPNDTTTSNDKAFNTLTVTPPPPPGIDETIPGDGDVVSKDTLVQIIFTDAMDEASVEGAFSINPAVVGAMSWSVDSMTFTFMPDSPLDGGTHTVMLETSAKSQDGIALETALDFTFKVDVNGPLTYDVASDKNPVDKDIDTYIVITATVDDTWNGDELIYGIVKKAEYFVDSLPTNHNGTGTNMDPVDGTPDGYVEDFQAVITISSWTEGTQHTIYVHGKDSFGNWGEVKHVDVDVADNSAPQFNGLNSAPNTGSGGTVQLSWDEAIDPSTPIAYNIYISTEQDTVWNSLNTTTEQTTYRVDGLYNGQKYWFGVRSLDSFGNEDTNNIIKSATPTDWTSPNFAGLDSVVVSEVGGTVTLFWNEANDTDTSPSQSEIVYNIYKDNSASFSPSSQNQIAATTSLSFAINGLTNVDKYYFIVRAEDMHGNEERNTNRKSATPMDTQPPEFSGIEGVANLEYGGKLYLNWSAAIDNNTDPSGWLKYNIYYKKAGAAGWTKISTSQVGITLEGLTNDVEYVVKVTAYDDSGNEDANTIELRVTPTDETRPTFNGIKTMKDEGTSGAIMLTWEEAHDGNTDPEGGITYYIYLSTDSAIDYDNPYDYLETPASQYKFTNLQNGQTYYSTVKAVDDSNNQDANNVVKSTTPTDSHPPAFAGLGKAADAKTGGAIELTWDAATDPSSPITYYLYRSTSPSFTPSPSNLITAVSVLSYTDRDSGTYLTNGKTYYYIVRAQDSLGNADENTIYRHATPSDTTAPEFSGLKTLSDDTTGNSVSLNWQSASDPSTPIRYNIYRSTSDSIPSSYTYQTTSTSFKDTNLTNGMTYWYTVRTEDRFSNEDANGNTKSVIPSDSTPPSFNGLNSAEDQESGSSVLLEWNEATDFSGDVKYNIYRGVSSVDTSSPEVTGIMSTQYVDVGLVNGKIYYYIVRAEDQHDNEDSNQKSLSAIPTKPNDVPELSNPSGPREEEVGNTLQFSVIYKDNDGDEPVHVRIFINNVPYDMLSSGGSSPDYKAGVIYTYSTSTLQKGTYMYMFEAKDSADENPATNGDEKTVKTSTRNLEVTARDEPIELSNYNRRKSGDEHEFSLTYKDPDGGSPQYVEVVIDGTSYAMRGVSTNYESGVKYTYSTEVEPGDHTYYFRASDGTHRVISATETFTEPEPPKVSILQTIEGLASNEYAGIKGIVWALLFIVILIGAAATRGRARKGADVIHCPNCSEVLQLATDVRPIKTMCPKCRTSFILR